MPIHKIERVGDTWKFWKDSSGSDDFEIAVDGGSTVQATIMTNFIQENAFDVRVLLDDLPGTAPEKTVDPGRPDYFWLGPGGQLDTYLVSRSVEITVLWDTPELPGDYTVTLRSLTV